MSIVQKMRGQLAEAMKARDTVRLGFLRYWIAQLTLGTGAEMPEADAIKKMRGVLKEAKSGPTTFTAEEVIRQLEPYCSGFLCTYVDKEGMMQGTDLEWFRRLRAATSHEITAAGGITTIEDIRALKAMNIHAALGMAIYTGALDLAALKDE